MDIIVFLIVIGIILAFGFLSALRQFRLVAIFAGILLIMMAFYINADPIQFQDGYNQTDTVAGNVTTTIVEPNYVNVSTTNSSFDTLMTLGLGAFGIIIIIGGILSLGTKK